ncbi:cardiolipin synthase [Bacillus shivajii]|uniref:cardiolipin synthase n=1 Tax=Bacillus shivajii TaxID=1983719 RepID=UPI001CF9BD11|nr:cardiolipin synthase [Bacillus shivajii]UCZ53059.1 cardiolipin synthase [Bacillus shivajii]
MTVFLTILVMILLFFVWVTVDIWIGRKIHKSRVIPYKPSPERKSDAHFFSHGDKLFDDMLKEVYDAKDHIHMQFYIFRNDSIGNKMLMRLMEKAREGVEVRLLVDWIGNSLPKEKVEELRKAGIYFTKANAPQFPLLFFSLNFRNHRKITVIDGDKAYIGGFNIGDEYLGRDPKMGRWRDYHLRVTGESVADLQKQFLLDWERARKEKVGQEDRYFPPLREGPLTMQIVPTDGAHVIEKILTMIDQAKEFVFIGTPYFIPEKQVLNKLISLSKNGVRVQVLIPKYPDHPLVKDAAFNYIKTLLNTGIEIRQFYEGFYHSKAIIVDDKIVDIGTANFDKRSFHLNHEVNCIIHDLDWIRQVKEEIDDDFYKSSEKITFDHIKQRSIFDHSKQIVAKVLSPLM